MKIIELTSADRDRWNAFVAGNPYGDVCCRHGSGGTSRESGRRRNASCIAAVQDDGEIRAGALLLRRKLPVVGAFYYAPRGPLMADLSDFKDSQIACRRYPAARKVRRRRILENRSRDSAEESQASTSLAELGFELPPGVDPQGFGGTQPRCVMVLDIAGRARTFSLRNVRRSAAEISASRKSLGSKWSARRPASMSSRSTICFRSPLSETDLLSGLVPIMRCSGIAWSTMASGSCS